MNRWGVTVMLMVVLANTANARLGETPVQCAERYGPTVAEEKRDKFTIQDYMKQTHELIIRLTPELPLPAQDKKPAILEGF